MSGTTARPRPAASGGRKSTIMPTLVILALLGYGYLTFSTIWTDNLWFRSLGYGQVFTTQLWTRVGLFLIFGLLMGGAVYLSMWLAFRKRPTRGNSNSAVLDQYRALLESKSWLGMLVPAVVLGFLSALSAATMVPTYLAWRNATPFGVLDPTFGLDVSFFVFDYPWYRFLVSFVVTTLLLCALTAAGVHFAVGALWAGGQGTRRTTTGFAHAQLSILLGLTLLGFAVDHILDRWGLVLGSGELLDGLTYTEEHAQMGAHLVIAAIAVIVSILFFLNAWWRTWRTPAVAMILMVVSSLIVGVFYPGFVQAFDVKPDEPDKERPYIERHIQATREAFGVADVSLTDYSAKTDVAPGQLKADAAALPGIRLIDPAMVQMTFEQLQQVRGYYSFSPVLDVDRYTLDGKETDVVIAARELDQSGLPDRNWNNLHTVYTHGYGLVAAYGNRRQSGGEPEWISRDIPPIGKLPTTESRIYYGELTNGYAVVGRPEGAAPIEFDTPGGGQAGGEQLTTYSGLGGVGIGNYLTRILYATKFSDVNLLLSDRVNSESRILYDRNPRMRVAEAAPWLTVDNDTYPAIVDGRIVWIVDAYTSSDLYPNSHRVSLRAATADAMTSTSTMLGDKTVNYMRNSVKAVVDAYDGTVKLYSWDDKDPLLKTWMKVFPNTVLPHSDITPDLMAHLRYPEDMFKVQREVLARYHVTDPYIWYSQSDLWTVPIDPVKGKDSLKEPSYYHSIKWPGDAAPVFSQTTVFTPNKRENLAGYMAVVADAAAPNYGTIRVLRMSDTHQIEGPGQSYNNMVGNEKVAERLRPYLNQGSAKAMYGNLLTIPLGGGLMYVEPIYTQRDEGSAGAFPVLRFVVVRFGTHVAIGDTLQEALDQVFSGDAGARTDEAPPTTTPGTSTPGTSKPGTSTPGTSTPGTSTSPPPTGTVDQAAATQALSDAQVAFDAANSALKNGDLAGYAKSMADAQASVQKALKAMGR